MFVDIIHIEEAFKDYILNRLFPRFHLTLRECRVEVPLIGRKSCIRFLRTSSGDGYAIRAFLRSRLNEAKLLFSSQRFLEEKGLPVPHIVDLAEKYSSKGVSFLTEEYLPGESWETLERSPEAAGKLGGLLAQLHLLESDSWGAFGAKSANGKGFGDSQFGLVKNRLYRIGKFLKNDIPSSEFSEIRNWFRGFTKPLNSFITFQLIHNKINRGNVIFSQDKNSMFLLDFSTLQYGYRGKDIVQAERALLKNDDQLVDEFQKEYFRHFPDETKKMYDVFSPFYHAYYHLSKCAANIRRNFMMRSNKNDETDLLHRKFLSHWNALLSLVRKS
ncbi:phosphotransferase [Candidatus Sumerlaeota bacterium]|nr:phosphotransferase [Candidatus Sumerlaeota bacterium]